MAFAQPLGQLHKTIACLSMSPARGSTIATLSLWLGSQVTPNNTNNSIDSSFNFNADGIPQDHSRFVNNVYYCGECNFSLARNKAQEH